MEEERVKGGVRDGENRGTGTTKKYRGMKRPYENLQSSNPNKNIF